MIFRRGHIPVSGPPRWDPQRAGSILLSAVLWAAIFSIATFVIGEISSEVVGAPTRALMVGGVVGAAYGLVDQLWMIPVNWGYATVGLFFLLAIFLY